MVVDSASRGGHGSVSQGEDPTVGARTSVRRRLVAGIGVLMAATLAMSLVPQEAQAAETAAATRHWQSGVFTGKCGSGPVTTFGKWRGAPVERTSAYLEPTTWTQLTETISLGGCIAGLGMPV